MRALSSRVTRVSKKAIFEVDRWPGTDFPLDPRFKSGYYSGGEGGSICKGKLSLQIDPLRVGDFPSDISLNKNNDDNNNIK